MIKYVKEKGWAKVGSYAIITNGPHHTSGGTNLLNIVQIT